MKAVLLIDMPKSCADCKYCGFEQFTKKPACVICEGNFDIEEDIENKRSAICPLKSLPEKKSVELACQKEDDGNDYGAGLIVGWNECLEEITGKQNERGV